MTPRAFGLLDMESSDESARVELDAPRRYTIALSDEAVMGYAEVEPDRMYERIGDLIDFLAEHPYYGQVYDPYYESARPPVPCRVFYCGHYGVYYHVDDSLGMIYVFAIEDQRRDPLRRFSIVEGSA